MPFSRAKSAPVAPNNANGPTRVASIITDTRRPKNATGSWTGTAYIERPIEEVFAFLADGENDSKFSPRVRTIAKATEGPPTVGTVYVSAVKDAGRKIVREFTLTEFAAPVRIRWTELSANAVTVRHGGYDLAPENGGTRLTVHNELEGHGIGKVLAPLALRGARKDGDEFARRIKEVVEAS